MNKTFAITGKLEGFSCEGAIKHIELNGGQVVERVTKDTDYLVAGANPGSKLDKAQALGVKVIDAEMLDSMFDVTVENGVTTASAFESGLI